MYTRCIDCIGAMRHGVCWHSTRTQASERSVAATPKSCIDAAVCCTGGLFPGAMV